ncbi:Fructose-bisphosphate aldolase class II (EC [uncultured Gammaproteobacteria bacterium]|nr:Fructose-bisphosphate aldolase class II (EC [uncultured Gammaproteobacteria bacterium]
MSDICAARFEAFGSAGNADKIKGLFIRYDESKIFVW